LDNKKLAERPTSLQTSKRPEHLGKSHLYHVDASHDHRIFFAFVVFYFLTHPEQGIDVWVTVSSTVPHTLQALALVSQSSSPGIGPDSF
jgi:hypothetical protein